METLDSHDGPDEPIHAVVVAGGDAPTRIDIDHIDIVIAADSGADTARHLGLAPDIVVGDLDSISAPTLESLVDAGVAVERHDPTKDESDLELALDLATRRGATRITVVGGGRGRLSHLLVNAVVIATEHRRHVVTRWLTPVANVDVVHGGDERTIAGDVGDLITLLPLFGAAAGVVTTGLRWPLEGRTIHPGSSLGLSNEMTATEATVTLEQGTLLIVHETEIT